VKYDYRKPEDRARHDADRDAFYAAREAAEQEPATTGSFWTDIPWYGRLSLIFIVAWFAGLLVSYALS